MPVNPDEDEEIYPFVPDSPYWYFWVEVVVLRQLLTDQRIDCGAVDHPYFDGIWSRPELRPIDYDATLERLLPSIDKACAEHGV